MGNLGVIEIAILAAFLIVPIVLLMAPVAYQAYRRGYNPIVWGLAGLFAFNPIFPLVMLAMVPHRSRLRLREQYARELDEKLAGRAGVANRSETEPGSPRVETNSLGDQATELPQNRSIGDDLTRL